MEIRRAEGSDLCEIMRIYRAAKAFMDASGNPTQWTNGYPSEQIVQSDIAREKLYVIREDGEVHAVFYFAIEEEPVYRRIDHGAWRSNAPYGVIHRVASDGTLRGVMKCCVAFCREQIANLRIDTHQNNLPMQRALEREGFLRCGIVYLESGDERIAYQLC